MKITKDYLRQLIRESLEEGEKDDGFSPRQLPYEQGEEEADVSLTNVQPHIASTINKVVAAYYKSDKNEDTKLLFKISLPIFIGSIKKANPSKSIESILNSVLEKENKQHVDDIIRLLNPEQSSSMRENKKLSKDYVRQLIREAMQMEVEDPSIAGSRMDSREVYGDEGGYKEGEEEESEVVRELESIITDLMSVKKKLELAQNKEGK